MTNGIQAEIERIERDCGGEISLAARDLQTGWTVEYHADRKVKTASVIKLPILVHLALCVSEGSLDWNEILELTDAEKVGGAGVLSGMTAGLKLSLRDLAYLMTVISDNTATNMLIEFLGVAPVNERMNGFGLKETCLLRKSYSPDTPESALYGMGVTTPNEMLRLLTLLHENQIGSFRAKEEVMDFLFAQQIRDRIPRYLPPDWRYLGKTGGVDGVRNDVGIVTAPDGRAFALSLFVQNLPPGDWTPDNPGLIALSRLAESLIQNLVQ